MTTKNQIEVKVINGFVDQDKGGNPAGVVLDADRYTDVQKQKIASLVGLSETAFVSRSSVADFKLDFFTPTRQIPHCGHATVAVFSHLSQIGLIRAKNSSKETIDGIRKIIIDGDLAFMEQLRPRYQEFSDQDKQAITKSIGANPRQVTDAKIVDTGNSFAVIQLDGLETLQNLQPDFEAIKAISDQFELIGYYVFALKPNDERIAAARMFAPSYGINEEAATGMAAGPLGCYLYDFLHIERQNYLIEQGTFMEQPSPSLLTVQLQTENREIRNLMVGGKGMALATEAKYVAL